MNRNLGLGRILCWFSCGAASAVATKIAIEKYRGDEVEVLYCDTSEEEHADNSRFLSDCERWFGVPIKKVRSKRFSGVVDTWEREGYVAGPKGASCTKHLKRNVRRAYQDPSDIHIIGYTADKDDMERVPKIEKDNPGCEFDWVLIDRSIDKQDCIDTIIEAGIAVPTMYLLGYQNNNCIGCCKGGAGYWAKVRQDFPKVFAARCEQFTRIGFTPIKIKGKRIPLSELPADYPPILGKGFQCGSFCSKDSVSKVAIGEADAIIAELDKERGER